MAKKRTKVEKRRAAMRRMRQFVQDKNQNGGEKSKNKLTKNLRETETAVEKTIKEDDKAFNLPVSLLGYDPQLLKQDLLKTLLLSVAMFGSVVGLFFYLR